MACARGIRARQQGSSPIRYATNRTASPLSDGLARFRKFALGVALLVGAGVFAYPQIFQSVNSKLAGAIQKQLNIHLEKVGLVGSIADAKFVEGKGIQLTGLKLNSDSGKDVFAIEKALIHAPAQLPDLLAGNFKPTSIELFEVAIQLSREADGHWNLEPILSKLSELKTDDSGKINIPISLRNSKIRYIDHLAKTPIVHEFDNLQLNVQPDANQAGLMTLTGSIDLFGDSQCSFSAQPSVEGTTDIAFDFSKFPINRTTLGLIPPEKLPVGFRGAMGLIDGRGSFRLENATKAVSNLVFKVDLNHFAIDHIKMPHIISECFGPIKIENGILSGDLSGNIGSGNKLHGQFRVVGQQVIADPSVWRIDGKCRNMTLDHRLSKPFPQGVKTFFADFDPRGVVDVDFSLAHDHKGMQKSANANVSGMRFNFVKFPYPISGVHGKVILDNDELSFDVTGDEQGQPVHFTGNIMGNGKKTKSLINFWNEGQLPIDQKMITAVAAVKAVAPSLLAFRPQGFVRVTGQARKPFDQPHFDLDYDVHLIDCKSQHEYFEYPFSNINGLVSVRNTDVRIQDVRSTEETATAICNGNWNPQNGLQLRFDVHKVPLDQKLASALTPEVRYVWDAVRPDGIAHYVRVDLTTPPNLETNVVIESVLADPQNPASSTAAITPLWFPYRIANLDGRIRIGDGNFRMDRIRGKHGQTWLACNSFGNYTAEKWNLQFSDLRVGAIRVDDDLLKAVPDSLREALVGLNYRGNASATGTVNMGGSLIGPETPIAHNFSGINTVTEATTNNRIGTVSYDQPASQLTDQFARGELAEPEPEFEMNWDVRLDVDQGRMNVGLEIENVFGYVTLDGRYDGQNVVSNGAIAVDSLHFMNIQVTDVRGPMFIDNNRVAVGSMSKRANDPTVRESLVANIYGGAAQLDGQSWIENGEDQFYIQTLISNSNLQTAMAQLSPQLKEVGGLGSLALQLSGGETRESIRGEGQFQLRDANIYELPLVLAMLKTLKTRRNNRTAFDASNAAFTISGNNVNLNRVELLGDSISLIGEGQLDLRGQIGMNFYSVMGRNRLHIPILSELANASSQRIMWWKVDGTFAEPQIRTEILPGLNESVNALFQIEESNSPRWAQDPFSTSTIQR